MALLLTLAVCITWAALVIVFCGIGVCWLRRLTGLAPGWRNAYLAVWAGFGSTMTGLLVWNFFLPVDTRALCLFALAGAISIVLERRWFAATLSGGASSWFLVAAGAVTLWTANHALAIGGMDDNNYEFQAVRWFHDYRIVPGLANLHGRMGFNNSHHLLAAMLSFGPWSGGVNHLFNGLFVVLGLTLLLSSLRDISSGRITNANLTGALLLSPTIGLVLFGIFGPMISTLKADVFISAGIAVIVVLFVEFAETSSEQERYFPLAATLSVMSAVFFSVKITSVVFCGSVAVAVFIRLLATAGFRHRVTLSVILMTAVIVCSVFVRGVILSGYPLYPATAMAFNVDWRVPAAQASADRAMITSWAQLRPTYDAAAVRGWTWVSAWLRSTALTEKFNIVFPLTLASVCALSLVFRARGTRAVRVLRGPLAVIAAAVLALLMWFLQAPAGRFAFMYCWILFAVLFATTANRAEGISRRAMATAAATGLSAWFYCIFFAIGIPRDFRSGMLLMFAFAFVWLIACAWAVGRQRPRLVAVLCLALGLFQIGDRVLGHILRHRLEEIGPLIWLPVATLPERLIEPRYTPRRTLQGFIVFEAELPRYDTPLPNTKYFNPSLELRTPGDLGGGFRNRYPKVAGRYGYSVQAIVTRDLKDADVVTPDYSGGLTPP